MIFVYEEPPQQPAPPVFPAEEISEPPQQAAPVPAPELDWESYVEHFCI